LGVPEPFHSGKLFTLLHPTYIRKPSRFQGCTAMHNNSFKADGYAAA